MCYCLYCRETYIGRLFIWIILPSESSFYVCPTVSDSFGRSLFGHSKDISVRVSFSIKLSVQCGMVHPLTHTHRHFDYEIWYIRHCTEQLRNIRSLLPRNRNKITAVRREMELLRSTVHLLHGQTDNSLTRIDRLFTDSDPQEGVGELSHDHCIIVSVVKLQVN